MEVRGDDDGKRLVVSALRAVGPALEPHALIGGKKKVTRKWAFVLVDTGGGMNVAKADMEKLLFGAGRGTIRDYYQEVSFGLQDVEGQVFGPYKVDVKGDLCNPNDGGAEVLGQIGGMVPRMFDQYLWDFGQHHRGLPLGGRRRAGPLRAPHPAQLLQRQHRLLDADPGARPQLRDGALVRVPLRRGRQGRDVAADGDRTLRAIEYGNPFDPMGSGCGHMNGIQKAYEGWLEGCNVVKASASGTFTIFPLESACNGVELLQIPSKERTFMYQGKKGLMSSYFLELRVPTGYEVGAIDRGKLSQGEPVPLACT